MNAPTATPALGGSLAAGEHAYQAGGLTALGAVELVLGLIAIVWPAVAGVSIAILIGSLLVAAGAVGLVSAFGLRGRRAALWGLLAAVALAAGVYLLAEPEQGLIGLTKLLVIVLLASGGLLIAAGLVARENRAVPIAAGVFDVLLGVLVWAELPSSADWAIGLLVGLHLLASGIQTTSAGIAVRRSSAAARRREVAARA